MRDKEGKTRSLSDSALRKTKLMNQGWLKKPFDLKNPFNPQFFLKPGFFTRKMGFLNQPGFFMINVINSWNKYLFFYFLFNF